MKEKVAPGAGVIGWWITAVREHLAVPGWRAGNLKNGKSMLGVVSGLKTAS
jgi:hypothetical protein